MFFKVLQFSAAALCLFAVPVAGADVATTTNHSMPGRQLYNLCTSNAAGGGHSLEAGECLGYIVGVADTFDCVEANHGLHWDPQKAGGSQMKLVVAVLQWLDAHPAAMNEEAHHSIGAALQQSFPCK